MSSSITQYISINLKLNGAFEFPLKLIRSKERGLRIFQNIARAQSAIKFPADNPPQTIIEAYKKAGLLGQQNFDNVSPDNLRIESEYLMALFEKIYTNEGEANHLTQEQRTKAAEHYYQLGLAYENRNQTSAGIPDTEMAIQCYKISNIICQTEDNDHIFLRILIIYSKTNQFDDFKQYLDQISENKCIDRLLDRLLASTDIPEEYKPYVVTKKIDNLTRKINDSSHFDETSFTELVQLRVAKKIPVTVGYILWLTRLIKRFPHPKLLKERSNALNSSDTLTNNLANHFLNNKEGDIEIRLHLFSKTKNIEILLETTDLETTDLMVQEDPFHHISLISFYIDFLNKGYKLLPQQQTLLKESLNYLSAVKNHSSYNIPDSIPKEDLFQLIMQIEDSTERNKFLNRCVDREKTALGRFFWKKDKLGLECSLGSGTLEKIVAALGKDTTEETKEKINDANYYRAYQNFFQNIGFHHYTGREQSSATSTQGFFQSLAAIFSHGRIPASSSSAEEKDTNNKNKPSQ